MGVPEIRVEELKKRLDSGENLFLLDVRDEYEFEISNIGGQLIPLPELRKRLSELDVNQKIVTVCKMGPRGAKAVQVLNNAISDNTEIGIESEGRNGTNYTNYRNSSITVTGNVITGATEPGRPSDHSILADWTDSAAISSNQCTNNNHNGIEILG